MYSSPENYNLLISIGCFAATMFLLSFTFLMQVSQVPSENRFYHDSLPLGFILMWPCIRMLVHFFGPQLSISLRKKLHQRLCNGGADYILSAEQYFFSHFTAGLYLGCLAYLSMQVFEMDSPSLFFTLFLSGLNLPNSWLKKRIKDREKKILRSLPTYLDILTLAIESGSNFTGALNTAVKKSSACPLKQEFTRVLREIQAGKSKTFALNGLQQRIQLNAIHTFVSSIIQAEKTGSQVGKILRAQADQRRFERFAKAEKLGMEAPVKLLGPLVMFIFPTTFIILIFLIVVKVFETGMISSEIFHILMLNPIETISGFQL